MTYQLIGIFCAFCLAPIWVIGCLGFTIIREVCKVKFPTNWRLRKLYPLIRTKEARRAIWNMRYNA